MDINYQTMFEFLLMFTVAQISASHFRGGIIAWKPSGNSQNEIIVDFRVSWRMTYSTSFHCDNNIIRTGTIISGEGDLVCFSNCGNSNITMGALNYRCTDFSTIEDWSSGLGSIKYTFPARHPPVYEFGFQGGNWIDTLNFGGGGNWYLWTKADLSVRNDTGRINSSPTAQIPPIVRLQYGCNHTITIPVTDPDGDVVKCHWAYARNNNCGSVCNGFQNSYLNFDACTITYQATYNTGWYAVAIQVEDYPDRYSNNYISSIPVQFLVYVYPSNASCTRKLEFIDPTLPENARICVPSGESYKSSIVARVTDSNASISEIKTISPAGLTHSDVYEVSRGEWAVNFTYTPQINSPITNIFCFVAKETSGLESDKRCITFLNGGPAPLFVNGSQSPSGRVSPYQRHWSIRLDSEFDLPTNHSFIRLYDAANRLIESIDASDSSKVMATNKMLEFVTSASLQTNAYYYFLFDNGVVKGKTNCGAESLAIYDPYFWRFYVDYMYMQESSTSIPWWNYLTSSSLTTPSRLKLEDAISVNCDEYGWEINVDMDILRRIYPSAKAMDIYLGENTCTGNQYGNVLTFRQGLRECLTSESFRNNAVVYSNELVYAEHDPQHPFIIRHYAWIIGVECDVQRNESSSAHLHHQSVNSGANLVSSNNHYAVNMTLFRDSNYQYPIQGNPLEVPVGTEVFVKVFTAASDWTIKMRVHTCYTKPTSSAPDNMKYFLITNGCESDVNTHMISQSAHETRFVFRNFEYTGNHEGIFVFCDATFCGSTDYSTQCMQTCNPSG